MSSANSFRMRVLRGLFVLLAVALAGCPITTVCRPGRVTDDAGDCLCSAGTVPGDGGVCVPADGGM